MEDKSPFEGCGTTGFTRFICKKRENEELWTEENRSRIKEDLEMSTHQKMFFWGDMRKCIRI
jgi:hypothetical protein